VGESLNVGIVGLGVISAQYLDTIERLPMLNLVAVADLAPAAARVVADRYRVRAGSVAELLADPEVEVVLNLTTPGAHAEIALAAIAAGKGVYGEKPLALDTAEARQILDAAAAAGVVVGCAPDTVLGTGVQTARKALDDGLIGQPISATATFMSPGHERWHPNPDFYYAPGGGPLLDMGPYYLTALITLFGPVASVIGAASRSRSLRTITSGPRTGQTVPVGVDSHVTGVLTHASGVLSTVVMSFDAVATQAANLEVHGETGSLIVPDPNHFSGVVQLRTLADDGWRELPVSAGYLDAGRGVGLADLALEPHPDSTGQPRAGGDLAYHVLEVMESVLASAHQGRAVSVLSSVPRPTAVPLSSLI
jgi:predicted dehydrogenase